MEIDYKNQLEQLEQQLRSVHNQLQVTLDECRTQQDLQETMKLEITSIQVDFPFQHEIFDENSSFFSARQRYSTETIRITLSTDHQREKSIGQNKERITRTKTIT